MSTNVNNVGWQTPSRASTTKNSPQTILRVGSSHFTTSPFFKWTTSFGSCIFGGGISIVPENVFFHLLEHFCSGTTKGIGTSNKT